MMTATHMMIGMALGYILGLPQPEIVSLSVLVGMAGGLIPDLDIVFEHNKTLHFPVYYPLLGGIAITSVAFFPSPEGVLALVFFMSATLHCFADMFVGSLGSTLSGEENNSNVYLHPEQRWIGSSDTIRYSGAPEDLTLSLLTGIPLFLLFDGLMQWIVALILVLGAVYSLHQMKEYRRFLMKKDAPTIEELFEEAKESRGS